MCSKDPFAANVFRAEVRGQRTWTTASTTRTTTNDRTKSVLSYLMWSSRTARPRPAPAAATVWTNGFASWSVRVLRETVGLPSMDRRTARTYDYYARGGSVSTSDNRKRRTRLTTGIILFATESKTRKAVRTDRPCSKNDRWQQHLPTRSDHGGACVRDNDDDDGDYGTTIRWR